MKSLTEVINRMLSRAGLHISRDSSFEGLRSTLRRAEAEADALRTALERELKKNEHERLLRASKQRWADDEPDAGLTWGVLMSGDEFVRFVLRHVRMTDRPTIIEIGPGYGRILRELLRYDVPFRRYIGLEISAARVNRLSRQFPDPRIEFREADILGGVELNASADVTISSAVFEHLYPDFSRAIETISGFTRPGGAAIIDFVRDENDPDKSASWFEKETTYIRAYSEYELKSLFEKSGFTVKQLDRISFGPDVNNREITRTVVFATKGEPAGRPIESISDPIQIASDMKPFDVFVHRSPAPSHDRALDPPVKPRFRSSFGGLWTDLDSAEAVLAGKVAVGDIFPVEAQLVIDWIRNGFVVLPGAVSVDAVDAALVDFERAYDDALGCKMSFWSDNGFHIEEASRAHVRKADAKLLDLHDVSEAVQRIIFAEPVSRFLHILFQRPALAFQSLGFYYGSQQHLHQDCAFVRVSSPLEFVASWIALEDIQPGSGELEYYPGSHLLPPHMFADKHIWVDYDDPELKNFHEKLHNLAKQSGLSMQRFLAKKGDVFIWAPGLMHGGSPVSNSNLTRKSLVTHYCPADQQPMFAYKGGLRKRKSLLGHYVIANPWELRNG